MLQAPRLLSEPSSYFSQSKVFVCSRAVVPGSDAVQILTACSKLVGFPYGKTTHERSHTCKVLERLLQQLS